MTIMRCVHAKEPMVDLKVVVTRVVEGSPDA